MYFCFMKSNYSNAFFLRKNVWIVLFSFFVISLFAFQSSSKNKSTSEKFKTLQLSEVLYKNLCNKVSIASYGIKNYDGIELSCSTADIIQDSADKNFFIIIPKTGNKAVVEIKSNKALIGTVEWRVVSFEPKIKWFVDTTEVKNKIVATKNWIPSIQIRIELPPVLENAKNQLIINANCQSKSSSLSNWTDHGKCNLWSNGLPNSFFTRPYLINSGSAYSVRITNMYLKNCKNEKLELPVPKNTENSAVVVLI